MKKRLTTLITVLLFILLSSRQLFAQIPPGDPGDGQDPDVPLTGIEWLILSGGLFGARKVYGNYQKRQRN